MNNRVIFNLMGGGIFLRTVSMARNIMCNSRFELEINKSGKAAMPQEFS